MAEKSRGIALIALVMLIVFVSIAVLSTTVFITGRLREEVQGSQLFAKCIYLAQAGVHNAAYSFRFNKFSGETGFFSLDSTSVNPNETFTLSATAANLLMVDTSASLIQSSNRNVTGWNIQNATNSNSITISRMTVSWTGVPANRRLQQIWLDDTQLWPIGGGDGSATSGTNLAITNFTLDTDPTIYTDNILRFNNNVAGITATVTFQMTDNSTQTLTIFPISQNYNFKVTSKGQVSGSTIFRSIQATYNALTGRITSYKEV